MSSTVVQVPSIAELLANLTFYPPAIVHLVHLFGLLSIVQVPPSVLKHETWQFYELMSSIKEIIINSSKKYNFFIFLIFKYF